MSRSEEGSTPAPTFRTRQSNGLDQLFSAIRDQTGLWVLDLSGASQANISFITSLGHRLYAEDFLQLLDSAFGGGDFYANQSEPKRVEAFLEQTLNFPDEQFDAALVWDTFQFLTPPLLETTVERLFRVLRPQACLLAFFHADEKAVSIPLYSYRIADARTLMLHPRGDRRPAQFFNNRNLERLFRRFRSMKFFLTRDRLREVIVKR